MYVLNQFLSADCSLFMYHKIFLKNSYRSLQSTSLRFFWHLLRQNWSIIRGTMSLWSMFEIDNSLLSKENVVNFGILGRIECLKARIIDQFGHERCKKNLNMWTTIFSKNFSKVFCFKGKPQLENLCFDTIQALLDEVWT